MKYKFDKEINIEHFKVCKVSSLENLPENAKEAVNKYIKLCYEKNPSMQHFSEPHYCHFTSKLLSKASNGKIKVIEGLVLDKANNQVIHHSWNSIYGIYFDMTTIYNKTKELYYFGCPISNFELNKFLEEYDKYLSKEYDDIDLTFFDAEKLMMIWKLKRQ